MRVSDLLFALSIVLIPLASATHYCGTDYLKNMVKLGKGPGKGKGGKKGMKKGEKKGGYRPLGKWHL